MGFVFFLVSGCFRVGENALAIQGRLPDSYTKDGICNLRLISKDGWTYYKGTASGGFAIDAVVPPGVQRYTLSCECFDRAGQRYFLKDFEIVSAGRRDGVVDLGELD